MSDLAALVLLAKAIADRDLMELARRQSDALLLRSDAEKLRDTRHSSDDIAAVERWNKWKILELMRLEEARAKVLAEVDAARVLAQKSYGRSIALEELKTAKPPGERYQR